MDNVNAFDSFNEFFSNHPDVQLDEILHLSESLRYYRRLNGKTLNDICSITSYKKLCQVAAELEINRYKDYTVDVLKSMMIEKFTLSFARSNKDTNTASEVITSEDELIIQAPLELGAPFEISKDDEIDITECMKYCDIEFEEDNNGDLVIPTESSIIDFLRPTIRLVYKKMYRSLKFYKGRYYQYINTKWEKIDSLDDVMYELFMVLCKNSSTLNKDLQQMYLFINKNNKLKTRIRNVLLKSMDQTIKANSNVNLLQSCNEPKEYNTEQKMSTEEDVCRTTTKKAR